MWCCPHHAGQSPFGRRRVRNQASAEAEGADGHQCLSPQQQRVCEKVYDEVQGGSAPPIVGHAVVAPAVVGDRDDRPGLQRLVCGRRYHLPAAWKASVALHALCYRSAKADPGYATVSTPCAGNLPTACRASAPRMRSATTRPRPSRTPPKRRRQAEGDAREARTTGPVNRIARARRCSSAALDPWSPLVSYGATGRLCRAGYS